MRQADRMNIYIVRVSPLGDNFSGFSFDYQVEWLEGGASIHPVGMGIVLSGYPAGMTFVSRTSLGPNMLHLLRDSPNKQELMGIRNPLLYKK